VRIHIIGICGTFMGGLAILARQAGHQVTGSDQNVYPPMSTQLAAQGIELLSGYSEDNLHPAPDLVIMGNALSRGNPEVEAVMNRGLAYTSGPQWLYNQVLRNNWTLAVAGTHGKTTTSSMLAWILECEGLQPGFLIGGVPLNFGVSARLGAGRYFVVEADEYDTAFFDKRSKFVHYRPRTTILNNLEYDHADIFPDLAAIQRQFHHLVRSIPGNGMIVAPHDDPHLEAVLRMGCWTPVEHTALPAVAGMPWGAELLQADGSVFRLFQHGKAVAEIHWSLSGQHNVRNALAAIAAAHHAGVAPAAAAHALSRFENVKRRLEIIGTHDGITLYDDFAHHPTAIATTLEGLRARVGSQARIIAALEPRSNTMRMGVHNDHLLPALRSADEALIFLPPDLGWESVALGMDTAPLPVQATSTLAQMEEALLQRIRPGDHVIFMSNGSFGGLHQRILQALRLR
jgi:UDP-N-acetylmuramate: L-alanyl-gamma-D-glutamyl-meso-diaminopimelate ligase